MVEVPWVTFNLQVFICGFIDVEGNVRVDVQFILQLGAVGVFVTKWWLVYLVVGILTRAISIFRSDMSTKLRNARWVWSEEYWDVDDSGVDGHVMRVGIVFSNVYRHVIRVLEASQKERRNYHKSWQNCYELLRYILLECYQKITLADSFLPKTTNNIRCCRMKREWWLCKQDNDRLSSTELVSVSGRRKERKMLTKITIAYLHKECYTHAVM